MIFKRDYTLKQTLPYILITGGIIGLVSAFVIMYEKLQLLANPNYHPLCSINPIISCGNIMESGQSQAFGFPNPMIGLSAFAVVVTIGVAMLAGAKFKRWFWLGLEAGTFMGVVFIGWLAFQSIYSIQSLCPYCMVVWSVTIPMFWYTTLYNLREKHLRTPRRLKGLVAFLQSHHGDVLLIVYLVIIGLILQHFWYYWSTLL